MPAAECTVRIIFYGLMAFSTPQEGQPFEVSVIDARSGPEILPGVMVYPHEFKIERCIWEAPGQLKCVEQPTKNPEHKYEISIADSSSRKPAEGGDIEQRLPKLSETPSYGLLAKIVVPNSEPFVCHEVHKRCAPEIRRKYAMADIGDKPTSTFGGYRRRGDAVEIRFFPKDCDNAPTIKIERLKLGNGQAEKPLQVKLEPMGETLLVISNAPKVHPKVSAEEMDISAHYSLFYNAIWKKPFERFNEREVPVHWNQKASVSTDLVCEDFFGARSHACPVLPAAVPHDPVACIPPRY